MKVGLYFGSFNPIHVGHLIIANHMVEYTEIDQLWFVVTPQNPLKQKSGLLADYHRLAMVKIAIDDNHKLRASDIEFGLPKPSYTIDTLAYAHEKYPQHRFSLIMGEDNYRTLHKWKNYQEILDRYTIYVYPRMNDGTKELPEPVANGGKVIFCDAPLMKVSASFIRKAVQDEKSVKYLLTEEVHQYLTEMNFYKK